MDNKHRKILQSKRLELVRDLICSVQLMSVLEANGTLSNAMKEEVEASNPDISLKYM